MVSLGIDLSLTATGVIQLEDGKMKGRQIIKTKPLGKLPTDELNRLIKIRDLIKAEGCTIAVIEGLAFMARNSTALTQLSGLNYMVREMLQKMEIPFVVVQPTTLKKFITGKGNCPKDMMLLEIYKRYGISFNDDNEADAYGLARIGEALINKDVKLTKFQKEVIKLVEPQYI